jgi:hypothetical protein
MIDPAHQALADFVLDRATGESAAKRVRLYRALASIFPGRSQEFKQLTDLADELEAIDDRAGQLLLNFRRNTN